MPTAKLTIEVITAAIQGFEQQKVLIDDQIAELRAMMSGGSLESTAVSGPTRSTGRKISAAARKRMSEAQRKRWSESAGKSASSPSTATPGPSKPKRKLSAAGKAAIVAALKKRWAAKKAESGKAKPAGAKKADRSS